MGDRHTQRERDPQVALPVHRELQPGEEQIEGVCVGWINKGFGFGFLKVAGVERDVFVSANELANTRELRRGDRVMFDAVMDYTGRIKAVNASLLNRAGTVAPIGTSMTPERYEGPVAPWE